MFSRRQVLVGGENSSATPDVEVVMSPTVEVVYLFSGIVDVAEGVDTRVRQETIETDGARLELDHRAATELQLMKMIPRYVDVVLPLYKTTRARIRMKMELHPRSTRDKNPQYRED